ncbi:MAG TPA: TIGR03435 family protein [Candidatus Acidoferrales bacterium]|nr:TIGR03435 family protein [Candidatus Acidoferrales bacterium]
MKSFLTFTVAVLTFAAVSACELAGQSQSGSDFGHFTYDVASIKPHPSNLPSNGVLSSFNRPNHGVSAENVSFLSLIEDAFDIEESPISGIPGWLKSEKYDIEARVDSSTIDALEKLPPSDRDAAESEMLRALLVERMRLAVHRETREMPVYELTAAKNGPKLQPGDPAQPVSLGINWSADANGNNRISAKAATMEALAAFLSSRLHRTVLDKTGLASRYEFSLNYLVDPNLVPQPGASDSEDVAAPAAASIPGATGRALFSAIQEQLGLKLASARGPVEVIVIDHVERPDKN